jgi:hypothetical protein
MLSWGRGSIPGGGRGARVRTVMGRTLRTLCGGGAHGRRGAVQSVVTFTSKINSLNLM